MNRFVPALRSQLPRIAPAPARAFASSSRRAAEESASPDAANSSSSAQAGPAAEQDGRAAPTEDIKPGRKITFAKWVRTAEAQRYRRPTPGKPNWIGDTPFPMNPSFNPLPPLADTIRERIYNAYAYNIRIKDATDKQVVRAVSGKFGVSMDRVRAIIRLKELEEQWKQEGKALQTNLLKGMEEVLGVQQPVNDSWRGLESPEPAQVLLASRRTMFEMIDVENGESPVFLPLLKQVPKRGTPLSETPLVSKTDSVAPSKPEPKVLVAPASRQGRAPTVFRDLSGTEQGEKLASSYNPKKTKRGNAAKRIAGREQYLRKLEESARAKVAGGRAQAQA
ncbi:ribosomal protein S35, mitochondrial protein [Rhodotorula toruloides]|uniref:Ribosomal protein S35, mitochondrial protein n=1 Tax=Rhodotorula toruloides TaxID=5286 RepID=A0A511K9J9_RHOTO|nr:ribosomal protein S35, mitochondrial protein [Rhodotorula toruloides]